MFPQHAQIIEFWTAKFCLSFNRLPPGRQNEPWTSRARPEIYLDKPRQQSPDLHRLPLSRPARGRDAAFVQRLRNALQTRYAARLYDSYNRSKLSRPCVRPRRSRLPGGVPGLGLMTPADYHGRSLTSSPAVADAFDSVSLTHATGLRRPQRRDGHRPTLPLRSAAPLVANLTPGPPSSASMKMMPAFSSARRIASTVTAFSASPFSKCLTVGAETAAARARSRRHHPSAVRAIQHCTGTKVAMEPK